VQDLRAVLTVLLADEALVMQSAGIKARYAMAFADAFALAVERPTEPNWRPGNLSRVPGPHERFLYD
jgi:hypothetical protein